MTVGFQSVSLSLRSHLKPKHTTQAVRALLITPQTNLLLWDATGAAPIPFDPPSGPPPQLAAVLAQALHDGNVLPALLRLQSCSDMPPSQAIGVQQRLAATDASLFSDSLADTSELHTSLAAYIAAATARDCSIIVAVEASATATLAALHLIDLEPKS